MVFKLGGIFLQVLANRSGQLGVKMCCSNAAFPTGPSGTLVHLKKMGDNVSAENDGARVLMNLSDMAQQWETSAAVRE